MRTSEKPVPILIFISFVISLVMASVAIAQIYIWTDKDGVKHYSNTTPPPETDSVDDEIKTPNSSETKKADNINISPPNPIWGPIPSRSAKRNEPATKTNSYSELPYEISMVGVTSGQYGISVRGRISGGKPCKKLKVKMNLISDTGKISTVNFIVEEVGEGKSKIFETADYLIDDYNTENWEVGDVKYDCLVGYR